MDRQPQHPSEHGEPFPVPASGDHIQPVSEETRINRRDREIQEIKPQEEVVPIILVLTLHEASLLSSLMDLSTSPVLSDLRYRLLCKISQAQSQSGQSGQSGQSS